MDVINSDNLLIIKLDNYFFSVGPIRDAESDAR